MKYVEEYLKDVINVKPLGKLTTKDDELNGMSGEMVYIDGKCSDIFISHADYANWLERQGEQKPSNIVKPKFKIGDFLVNDYCMGKVIELTNDAYLLDTGQGIPFSCEHNVHLWTIQDAKDGDVLVEDSCIFIIKKLNYDHSAKTYCEQHIDGCFDDGSTLSFDIDSTKPATKEQRDFLFKKMKEAGYEWDAEKKELKKIHVIDEGKAEMDYCFTKMMKGEKVTPAWSEEDENWLINAINVCKLNNYNETADWLKSLKDRYTWKPSDEQMKALAQATVPDDCLEAYETLWHDLNNLRKTTK